MLKPEEKVWLRKLLKHWFKATAYLQRAELAYCEGDVVKNFTSKLEENDLALQKIEADTINLSAYPTLRKSYNGTVIKDSKDTEVYVQTAYVTHDLKYDPFIKNKNNLFKCVELVTSNITNVLIPFHVITGYDHTSGFYGRGKRSVFANIQKHREAQNRNQKVG